MKPTIDNTVKRLLDELGFKYDREAKGRIALYKFGSVEREGVFPISVTADEEHSLLVITGHYCRWMTEDNSKSTGYVVNTLNAQFPVGAILSDPKDGELTFRVYHCLEGKTLSPGHITALLYLVIGRLKQTVGIIDASMQNPKTAGN